MGIVSIRLFIRLLLGLILLSVGASKLVHPHRLRSGIQDYRLIPPTLESKLALSKVLSFCISLAELVAGLGLISGLLLVPLAFLTVGLFILFSAAIGINLVRGRHDLSCHCGGSLGDHRISWWLVGRNGLFMVGLFVLLLTPADVFTVDTFVRNPSALSATLWMSTVLPVTLLVVGTLIMPVLINAARIVLHPW